MKRAFLIGLALTLSSCGPPAAKEQESSGKVEDELRREMQQYASMTRSMDHAGIAALFDKNGELAASGTHVIHGPEEIEKYLRTFDNYQVLSESLTTTAVSVRGASAHVTGNYQQSVRLPEGNVANVRGTFVADWIRGPDEVWRIRRMAAFPVKERKGT